MSDGMSMRCAAVQIRAALRHITLACMRSAHMPPAYTHTSAVVRCGGRAALLLLPWRSSRRASCQQGVAATRLLIPAATAGALYRAALRH